MFNLLSLTLIFRQCKSFWLFQRSYLRAYEKVTIISCFRKKIWDPYCACPLKDDSASDQISCNPSGTEGVNPQVDRKRAKASGRSNRRNTSKKSGTLPDALTTAGEHIHVIYYMYFIKYTFVFISWMMYSSTP